MNSGADVVSKFVERSEKTEKLDEAWADEDGEKGVPDEESDDGMFGDVALFPGDFGVGDVGDDGGDGSGNEVGKPKKVVVFDDEIGKDGVKAVVEKSDGDADEKIASGVAGSFDIVD